MHNIRRSSEEEVPGPLHFAAQRSSKVKRFTNPQGRTPPPPQIYPCRGHIVPDPSTRPKTSVAMALCHLRARAALSVPRLSRSSSTTLPPPTRHYDGRIPPLPAPCHLVMPGARAGDGSPSTEGVSGRFSGSVLSSSDPPLPHGEGVLEWENGVTYSGSWEAGLHHGEGAKTHSNGGGYSGAYGRGLRVGKGAALYGGKWGYNKWVGTFVDDVQHGPGWLHKTEGAGGGRVQHTYEMGELAGSPPCNEEYAKVRPPCSTEAAHTRSPRPPLTLLRPASSGACRGRQPTRRSGCCSSSTGRSIIATSRGTSRGGRLGSGG
jgi:hypothetical protein